MVQREKQGGKAALDALTMMKLDRDASLLNGSSGIAPPAGGYVWERSHQAAAARGQH